MFDELLSFNVLVSLIPSFDKSLDNSVCSDSTSCLSITLVSPLIVDDVVSELSVSSVVLVSEDSVSSVAAAANADAYTVDISDVVAVVVVAEASMLFGLYEVVVVVRDVEL